MTAADHATAVQLLRSAAADHLTHLDPGERDELVERITGALDRCARKRAAEELRAAAAMPTARVVAYTGQHPPKNVRVVTCDELCARADALEAL